MAAVVILVVAALIIFAVIVQTLGVQHTRDKRTMIKEDGTLRPVQYSGKNIFVDEEEINRHILFAITEEDVRRLEDVDELEEAPATQVNLVTRYHPAEIIFQLIPVGLFVVLGLAAAIYFDGQGAPSAYSKLGVQYQFHAWYLILPIVLLAPAVSAMLWLFWRFSYLVVTDQELILIRSMPPWLWALGSPVKRIPLIKIDVADKIDTTLGNLIGYGRILVDTAATDDEAFKRIRFVPAHEHVARVIQSSMTQLRRARS